MSITLETVLGATKSVDPNIVIVNRVENIENPKINGPLLTANFARNAWVDKESDGDNAVEKESSYVVIHRPKNLGQLLLEKYVEDEQELASVYIMEEKERVEQHNNRERQKIRDWEKESKRLIAQWEERERRRILDWEERERKRHEEYDLETAIRQEEAERASLSYAELVFNALENKSIQIGAIRTQYQQQGYLSPLRQGWLRKLLSRVGIQDNTVIEDIVKLAMSKDAVLKEGLREILIKQLGVEFPEAKPKESLPPYEPTPCPKPEPRPIPNPRPEIKLKEVPPLLEQLEAVVMLPYNGQPLESLKLTQEAWNAAGISPQEVRDKAIKDVVPLNDQYLLVRVVGKSGKDSGNLNLAQIISGTPKALRPYFRRPAEVAYDAYALMGIIARAINDYFTEDEKGKEFIRGITDEKQPFLKRAIVEEMLQRSTPIASAMFPNLYAVVIGDEEPYEVRAFKENLNGLPPAYSIAQKWYVTNVTQAELQQYRNAAAEVIPGVKAKFVMNLFKVRRIDGEIKDVDDITQIIDTVRSLVDSVPQEYFELMEAKAYVQYAEIIKGKLNHLKREGKILLPPTQLLFTMRLELGEESEKKSQSLTATFGRFFMKGTNEWNSVLSGPVVASMVLKYNSGKTVEQVAYQAKPS